MAIDYDKELDSIQDDLDNLYENKVDVAKGKQLSTNDFTNEHLRKVNRIETKEYHQEIVSGVAKDIKQANDNHIKLADEFHRHLHGENGANEKFKKDVEDNLKHMDSLVRSANERMNEIWQNWDELIKEDQNHELRIQQLEGKTLTHDALIDNNTGAISNIQGEQTIQNAQIKELQDKSVELETRVVDVEVSDADQNHRLDIAENRIGTFTDRMTALEDGYAQRDARMDGLDAQVSRYTERMLAIELTEKAQNERIKAEVEKNKRQDIDIACLYAEAKNRMITIDTEDTAVELQNSREGFVVTNSIEGNTMVNCNKDVDKELTLLTSTVDVSSDNNVTLTEGVVDGGKVDVYLEGNTLVNVSKTKEETPITRESEAITGNHVDLVDEGYIRPVLNGNTLVNVCDQKDPVAITKSYTVETGNHVALQGEYDGKCRPVVTGNTMVNLAGDVRYSESNAITYSLKYIKDNTTYTILFNMESTSSDLLCGFLNEDTTDWKGSTSDISTGFNKVVITTGESTGKYFRIIGANSHVSDLVILEGDYTNKPIPGYFEGLQSSFEDKVVPENLDSITNRYIYESMGYIAFSTANLTVGSSYTLVVKNAPVRYGLYAPDGNTPLVPYTTKEVNSFVYNTSYGSLTMHINDGGTTIITQDMLDNMEVYLVEGDYTNYDFSDYDPTKAGKYRVDYVVTGKNKFDTYKPYTTEVGFSLSHLEDGKTYTVHVNNAPAPLKVSVERGSAYSDVLAYTQELGSSLTFTYNSQKDWKLFVWSPESTPGNWVWVQDELMDIQIEEGSVATEYEEYKEYKKTFYLNSPLLEGDTIEQQGDNVVHVHRYKEIVLDGNNSIPKAIGTDTANMRWILYEDYSSVGDVPMEQITTINNKYPSTSARHTWLTTKEGVSQNNMGNAIHLYLEKYSDGSDASKQALISELQQNPMELVYKLASPQYEVISTNDELLVDSYVNGHLDVDSVVPIKKVAFDNCGRIELKYIYPSTDYILQFESDNVGIVSIHGGENVLANQPVVKGINKFIITSRASGNPWINFDGIGFNASNIVVTPAVEQDFDYFSGMQSCFEDNLVTEGENAGKYEVTYKVTGKNKLDGNSCVKIEGYLSNVSDTGYSIVRIGKGSDAVSYIVPCKPNTTYHLNSNGDRNSIAEFSHYPIPLERVKVFHDSITTSNSAKWLMLYVKSTWTDDDLQVQLEEGSQATTYEPYKEYTKTLYLNSPLLEGDTIEEKDGNIYHAHRYKELVLNGSEDENWITTHTTENDKTLVCWINLPNGKVFTRATSDIFQSSYIEEGGSSVDWGTESIISGDAISGIPGRIALSVGKLKLTTTDILGFKTWLKSNPVTVIYELAEPQYELIQQSDTIAMPTYSTGHLDVTTAVPVDKVNFLHFEEELTYLYPSTSYTVQFTSDNAITVDITLGGKKLLAQSVAKGLNKISITTPETLTDNKLIIDGVGANISEVVVTNTNREFGYFEGMKSVGECESNVIEISSRNRNLLTLDRTELWGDELHIEYSGTSEKCVECSNKRFKVEPNTTYTFSTLMKATPNLVNAEIYVLEYKKGGRSFYKAHSALIARYDILEYSRVPYEFTTGSETQDIVLRFDNNGSTDGNTATLSCKEYSLALGNDSVYEVAKLNKKELTHEPLRAVGNAKDKYVLIDGKWYIERNCAEVVLDGSDDENWTTTGYGGHETRNTFETAIHNVKCDAEGMSVPAINSVWKNVQVFNIPEEDNSFRLASNLDGTGYFLFTPSTSIIPYRDINAWKSYLCNNPITVIYPVTQPTYEPIDYNPFEVYNEVTHISANSTIPCNVTVKNHGYNCILKPSTTYTVVSNQGVQNMTTPATLGDSLRFSGNGVLKDVMILEGTLSDNQIPGNFAGMESCFEQHKITDEYDEHFGYYEVNAKVVGKNLINQNEAVINSSYNSNSKTICFPVKPNTTYTYTSDHYKGGVMISELSKKVAYDATVSNVSNLQIKLNDVRDNTSFTTTSKTKYVFMNLDIKSNVQLEQGTEATGYEPYRESVIKFYIKDPLRGIGEVKDKVFVEDGKVKILRNCASVTFDGSDDEDWSRRNMVSEIHTIGFGMYNIYGVTENSYCNNFVRNYPDAIWNTDKEGYVLIDFVHFRLHRCKLQTQDVAGFKQWLQQNPLTVVYQLAEPTYEEAVYSGIRLSQNIWEKSTLFFDTNIPSTANISYSISTPVLDQVAEVSSVTDDQDALIIDMATQIAVLNMTM